MKLDIAVILCVLLSFCMVTNANADKSGFFELQHKDLYGVVGVHHLGICESNPTLLLEQVNFGSASRLAPARPEMPTFVVYARDVASMYASRCPNVSSIRFAVAPMPAGMECVTEEDCFLEVPFPIPQLGTFNHSAKIRHQNRETPIERASDMTEILAAGRFDIIEGGLNSNYKGYFDYYLLSYFFAYDKHCAKHIEAPVEKRLEDNKYSYSDLEQRVVVEERPPIIIHIERAHLSEFERRAGKGNLWAKGVVLTNSLSFSQMGSAIGFVTEIQNHLNDFVSQDCTGDRLRTVQHNMMAYSRGQSPLTGKYTTKKNIRVELAYHPSSAPVFVDAYTKTRQKLITEAAENLRHQRLERIKKPISYASIKDVAKLDEIASADYKTAYLDYHEELEYLIKNGKHTETGELDKIQQRLEKIKYDSGARKYCLLGHRNWCKKP